MSKKGVWQLEKLMIYFCDIGGSSHGTREMVSKSFIKFAEENPQIQFFSFLRRGKHPYIEAEYKSGRKHVQTLKNLSQDEIVQKMYELRNQFGDKAKKIGTGKITKRESIQGKWNPLLFKDIGPKV